MDWVGMRITSHLAQAERLLRFIFLVVAAIMMETMETEAMEEVEEVRVETMEGMTAVIVQEATAEVEVLEVMVELMTVDEEEYMAATVKTENMAEEEEATPMVGKDLNEFCRGLPAEPLSFTGAVQP